MSESGKKTLWASTTPLTAPVGRSTGTPRKHTRVVHAPPLRPARLRLAAALLAVGVGLQVAGLFPRYGAAAQHFPLFDVYDGPALSSSLAAVLQQVLPVVAWLVAALLLARGTVGAVRAGSGLAAGVVGCSAAVALCPLGYVVSSGTGVAGPGLWLTLGAALLGVTGVVVALAELDHSWNLEPMLRPTPGLVLFGLVAAALLCVGSAFGWRVYVLDVTGSNALHESNELTGAFSGPWPVMAAQAVVIVVIGGLILGALTRTGRAPAAIALGVGLAFVGRAAATVVRLAEGVTLRQAGITPASLKQYGITASEVRILVNADRWFWVSIGGLAVVAVLALYLVLRPNPPEEAL